MLGSWQNYLKGESTPKGGGAKTRESFDRVINKVINYLKKALERVLNEICKSNLHSTKTYNLSS